MTTKLKILLSILTIVVAFAFGRFSAPEKIKTEIKTVTVDNKTDKTTTDTNRDRKTDTTTTKETHPDGTTTETTHTVTETESNKKSTTDQTEQVSTTEDRLKEITMATSKVTLSAMYGIPVTGGIPAYGGAATRSILGPVTVGVWFLTPNVLGGSIGLQF